MADKIYSDIQTLEPGSEVELYVLDATNQGGEMAYFHSHRQEASIWWQGIEYKAYPVNAEGFGMSGDASQPTPTLEVADIDGYISQLCYAFNDLAKSKVIRRRTLVRFLDAVNFQDGNPEADPNEFFPDDVYYIESKQSQIPGQVVRFELRSALDLTGTVIPSRQIVTNVCQWLVIDGYRGPSCGYTGTRYFDENDNPVSDPSQDKCPGRMRSCSLRFGAYQELPFGSFPATTLVSQ